MEILINAAISLGIVIVGFIVGPLVKKWIIKLSDNVSDKGALTFIGSCASIGIKVIAIVIALSHLGINTSVIVGCFSALGLGISLALKDNMANVAGGIQILFTRPFMVGDYISCDNQEGTVTRIEIMFTILQTYDNQDVVIPNSVLVQETIINYSKEENRRVIIQFPVAFNEDVQKIRKLCLEIMKEEELVLETMPKEVNLESMNENSLTIGLLCWCRREDYFGCLHSLNEKIQKKRLEEGIRIPVKPIQVDSNS